MNIFLTAQVMAAENAHIGEELRSSLNQNVYEPNILWTIFSLLIVLGLIYATGFLYKKLIKVNAKLTKDEPAVDGMNEFKIVSGTSLGQGRSLHVVEINNKYLVIGATPGNISLLREFSKDEVKSEG